MSNYSQIYYLQINGERGGEWRSYTLRVRFKKGFQKNMLSVAILAAGKGTRMESSLPKVLHKISGKSLLQRVIDSCVELKPDQIFVITGHKSKEVQKSIPNDKKIDVVVQEPQSGTGHAIQVLCKEVKKTWRKTFGT